MCFSFLSCFRVVFECFIERQRSEGRSEGEIRRKIRRKENDQEEEEGISHGIHNDGPPSASWWARGGRSSRICGARRQSKRIQKGSRKEKKDKRKLFGDLLHFVAESKGLCHNVSNVDVAHHAVQLGRDSAVRVDVDVLA